MQPLLGEIDLFLKQDEEKELLRLSTAGSVDDGKSTLIGRLLIDSKNVYEDQIASVRKASVGQHAGGIDFALLTDGLRAEREQGITIDVAYRYFSTPRRKFIIADTPGHEQYTRNMVTGVSTVNLAIILVDARRGIMPQTRRHAFIAALMGVPHMVIAVNKMDLVGYSERVFEQIRGDFAQIAAHLQVTDLHFIPISAWVGDNVVENSTRMPWFEGPSLLPYLETVHIASDRNLTEMRFPVQYVIRSHPEFRGFAGQVASGIIRKGDTVIALPSGTASRVQSIVTHDGELAMAFAPMAVTVCVENEIGLGRGDMLVHPQHRPRVSQRIDARLVWMSERPLNASHRYLIKHTTHVVPARVSAVRYRIDINTFEKESTHELRLNEIGAVMLETSRPLFFDAFGRNRSTGSFILIDPFTNETMAAGMITGRDAQETESELPEGQQSGSRRITITDREGRSGHRAGTIWLAGNEEAAYLLELELFNRGCLVQVLAAERHGHTLSELALVSNAAGFITICSGRAIDVTEQERTRNQFSADRFLFLDATALGKSPQEVANAAYQRLVEHGFLRVHPHSTEAEARLLGGEII